jgi:acyl-CoA synthetase (AMP-forming)/AMP-acid ligase II
MRGATILPHPVYDPEEVLKRIQDDAVTIFPGPPALFQGLFDHEALSRYDISSLRGAVLGASSIAIETVVAMREKLGFENVITGFGMTETHGLATLCDADDPPEVVARTSGKALPGVELRVVDDDGQVLPAGVQGELQIRGFNVMRGYLDDPEQTAEAIDPEGWLRTGDICILDGEGYIDITDRKKDMFINGGFNVYPAEVERVMLEHPGISQVAIIGVPDSRLGEVGAAFVVWTPMNSSSPETLLAWCRKEMANYKAPRFVWTLDSLPMNAANKVLKTELRERAKGLMA